MPYERLTDDDLVALLFSEADALPRAAVDEFLKRGAAIAPRLAAIIDDKAAWGAADPRGWAVVHATYILAAMKLPGTVDTLLRAMERADEHDVEPIWMEDVALTAYGGVASLPDLLRAAADRSRKAGPRKSAMEAAGLLGLLHPAVEPQVTGLLRGVIDNVAEKPDVRTFAGIVLLDFARPEDRKRILSVAVDEDYTEDDVEEQYEKGRLEAGPPDDSWLSFYDPEVIQARRDGWEDDDTPVEDSEPAPEIAIAPPKVGRNDPCPCGSGKKHKKCCGK